MLMAKRQPEARGFDEAKGDGVIILSSRYQAKDSVTTSSGLFFSTSMNKFIAC
jgi:hypothetical protein